MSNLYFAAHSSNISSVYVKSYLYPDEKKSTKKKTEEVKVEKTDKKEIEKKGQQHIVNFQPVCFKFAKHLEYQSITKPTVESKVVQLEVCVVQKFTRKSFVVALWNMPLAMAVKKLVKEKFPLKAYLSTSLPENMKVYAIKENIPFEATDGWAVPYPDDPQVLITNAVKDNDSCKVHFSEQEEPLKELRQVTTVRTSKRSKDVVLPGFADRDSGSELCEVTNVCTHERDFKKEKQTAVSLASDATARPDRRLGRRYKKNTSDGFPSESLKSTNLTEIPSRSATPVWDDYTEPLSFLKDGDHDIPSGNPNDIVLPMAVAFTPRADSTQ